MKLNIKTNKGFTIIEVLIVLVLAATIILVALLAVPALNRNQRNNARRTDIGRLGGAAQNFLVNNGGALPSTTANGNTIITDAGTLSQYTITANSAITTSADSQLSIVSGSGGTVAALPTGSKDRVQLVTGAVCGSDGATTNSGATAKSMAIQYTLETGTAGTVLPVCQNI